MEVCRHQTYAGINQQGQHIYVSNGLQDSGNDRVQIDTAIDNIDQNEDTLDGKLTIDTMVTVVYKQCALLSIQVPSAI